MTSKKKPTRDGKFQGEELNGHVWDVTDGWQRDDNSDGKADAPDGFEVADGEGYDGNPPDRDGKRPDEVVGKFRWDVEAKDGPEWVDHVGVDRTKNVPDGYEHLGDGTEANPHRVVPISRW